MLNKDGSNSKGLPIAGRPIVLKRRIKTTGMKGPASLAPRGVHAPAAGQPAAPRPTGFKFGRFAKPAHAAAPKGMAPKGAAPAGGAAEPRKTAVVAALLAGLRGPLGEIAETVARLKDSSWGSATDWAEVNSGIRHFSGLLEDVIDVADGVSGEGAAEPGFVDMHALVTEVCGPFRRRAEANGVRLSVRMGELPPLAINLHRLRIILRALVDNAVRYTPSGRIGVTASYADGSLAIAVEDTGSGMPIHLQERIAEQGLAGDWGGGRPSGLVMVGRMALSLGGEVAFKSTPGIGTVIRLAFPGVKAGPSASPGRMASMQRIGPVKLVERIPRHARVLTVDSSPVHNAVMYGLLKQLGFVDVTAAADGREALMMLLTGTYDLVLTDLDLAEKDGRQLVAELRAVPAFRELPIYAVTADESVSAGFADLGFNGFVLKPITPEKLRGLLG